MKLQFVCQHFYPENYPLSKICVDLVKDGNEVNMLTGLPNYPEGYIYKGYRFFKNRKQAIDGVNVIRCGLISRGNSKIRLFLNYISFAISASFKALFLNKEFDAIIIIQTSPITMVFPGVVLKKLSKKPLYIYTFDLWPESIAAGGIDNKSRIYKPVLKLSKHLYSKADKIFISSKKFESYFNDVLDIKGNIYYLPFYDSDKFLSIKPKPLEKNKVDFVFAGNIGNMQSVQSIVLTANELKDSPCMFHIVGDGSAKQQCEQLAKELDLNNIKFYGKMPPSKMPEVYSKADAMLITLADNKLISYTLPNKFLSYSAAGKPIISCANGEINDVICDANCGFTSKAEDYLGLKKAIIQFLYCENKAELGENARKYFISNFSLKIFLKTIYSYIKN